MSPLVAGVDCSTQATKVLICNVDDGAIVAEGRATHTVTGRDGARETDPEVWWIALQAALAATGRSRDVAAIAVAGQQHGLCVVDRVGRPLRPALLWNDTRSASDARILVDALGGPEMWAERVGIVPVASFTISKWAWLRRVEPAVAAATRGVRLPHDELTTRLTGEAVTDRGDASGTGWWSTADEDYAADILELPPVMLDPRLLPHVLGPNEAAGEVTATAAAALGLDTGTLVGAGTGDNMGAALGLGVEPGVPVVSLGTSGTAYAVMRSRAVDATGLVAGFADATGRFLPLAATLNCTLAVDAFARWLGLERDAVDAGGEVVVLPYLDGERTPNRPQASGTVTGLRHDTTPGQILRATYEGAAASLLSALDLLAEQGSGLNPQAPIVLIGGGARGGTWQQVILRLSGRALEIPDAPELVALGAAAQAASLLSGEPPDAVARRWRTREGPQLEPVSRDEDTLARIRDVLWRTGRLHA